MIFFNLLFHWILKFSSYCQQYTFKKAGVSNFCGSWYCKIQWIKKIISLHHIAWTALLFSNTTYCVSCATLLKMSLLTAVKFWQQVTMALQNNKIGFNCIASYALLYHGLSFIRSLSQLEALETGNALSLLLFSTPTFLMYTKQWLR